MKKIFTSLLVSVLLFSISQVSYASNNSSERIKGVAEFLIDRANDNYLYIFQKKIQDNQKLACYFPTTYDNLTIGGSTGLKRLLTSRELWKDSIQKDLEILAIRSLVREIDSAVKLSDKSVTIASGIINALNAVELVLDDGSKYSLTSIDPNEPQQVKDLVNGFSNDISNVLVAMSSFRDYAKDCDENPPKIDFENFKKKYDAFFQFEKNMESWISHIETNAKYLRPKNAGWQDVCSTLNIDSRLCSNRDTTVNAIKQTIRGKMLGLLDDKTKEKLRIIKEMIDRVNDSKEEIVDNAIREAVCTKLAIEESSCTGKQAIIESIKDIIASKAAGAGAVAGLVDQELIDKIEAIKSLSEAIPVSKEDVTSRVFDALKKIKEQQLAKLQKEIDDAVGEAKEKLKQKFEENKAALLKRFDKLSKHILFFSSIADADTSDEVKSILENYTLPAVSFFEKRKEGNHVMVTSYLGLAYNYKDDDAIEDSNHGIFAPVGLEYSRGVDWFGGNIKSASVMVAPFDFGHPINLKLNNLEEDVEFDEIVAPSITFSLGLSDYPLTIGLGYQKGRKIEATNETEDRAILFVAFDMPLFSLFGD